MFFFIENKNNVCFISKKTNFYLIILEFSQGKFIMHCTVSLAQRWNNASDQTFTSRWVVACIIKFIVLYHILSKSYSLQDLPSSYESHRTVKSRILLYIYIHIYIIYFRHGLADYNPLDAGEVFHHHYIFTGVDVFLWGVSHWHT